LDASGQFSGTGQFGRSLLPNQQVFSSALYGRAAMKDFDEYTRTDHCVAVANGADPLTRVAWPPAASESGVHSFHQAQTVKNRQAMQAVHSWTDTHEWRGQQWVERWEARQEAGKGQLGLWDRLATPVAHHVGAKTIRPSPPYRQHRTAGQSSENVKAAAEAATWAHQALRCHDEASLARMIGSMSVEKEPEQEVSEDEDYSPSKDPLWGGSHQNEAALVKALEEQRSTMRRMEQQLAQLRGAHDQAP